jgi:tRNA-dihydrouridine synthase C
MVTIYKSPNIEGIFSSNTPTISGLYCSKNKEKCCLKTLSKENIESLNENNSTRIANVIILHIRLKLSTVFPVGSLYNVPRNFYTTETLLMRLMLAPMEGVIDHNMRAILAADGALSRCVTEFVRITNQLLPRRVFLRYCPELLNHGFTSGNTPVYLQLLGGQPGPMAENAAKAASFGTPGIDLNFGCPAKAVNKNDGGSILLRDTGRLYKIISAVRQAVPRSIPVTVKIRLGYEDDSLLLDNVLAIESAGANELTVHARTKTQGYRPPAYWQSIALVREQIAIPVIANGEIWDPAQAEACQLQSGCKDLMLGRGALCRPDLPRLIRARSEGVDCEPMAWGEIVPLLLRSLQFSAEQYEEKYVGNRLKQWLVYLKHYYLEANLLFNQVKRLKNSTDIFS